MPSPYLYIKGDIMFGKKVKVKIGRIAGTSADANKIKTAYETPIYETDFYFMIPETTHTHSEISSFFSNKQLFSGTTLQTSVYTDIVNYIPEFFKSSVPFFSNMITNYYNAFFSVFDQFTNCYDVLGPLTDSLTYIFVDSGNDYIMCLCYSSYSEYGGTIGYTQYNFYSGFYRKSTNTYQMHYDTHVKPSGYYRGSNGRHYADIWTYINTPNSISVVDFYTAYDAQNLHSNTSYIETLANYGDFFVGFVSGYNIPKDPYSAGGISTSGGGHGDFDTMTDTMSEPSYDAVESYQRGYANHGFAKVYIPTSSQLDALHTYLWSSNVFDVLKKMYASPIDCIISLNMIPLDLSSLMGDPPAQGNIIIGGTDTGITNVNMPYTQFIELDCGSISISEFFGSYLDYSPYTKLQIFLPYIGMQDLDVDDFMNGEIGVKYYIDIVSGDCVAYINQLNLSSNAVRGAVAGGAGVLYQFTGNVAFNVPISAENFAQIYAASAGAMISGSGMLAMALSGGMSAPMALTGIAATSVNVATSKPSISRGGSIPSTAGYLGIQTPYLILTRPRQCLPEDQNALIGYPAYVTVTIEDIEGYNEFEIVHLENIPATDAEKAEIEKLLKSGVIL